MSAPPPLPSLEKQALRRTSLAQRDAMPVSERDRASRTIATLGANAPGLDAGTLIAGFLPIRSEVDLRPLMDALRQRGAALCLPVVLDRQTICFRLWTEAQALVDTGFSTRGPGPEAATVDPQVLLVPLAAFDGRGNRIGYGAGHYDRAIARLRQKGQQPQLIGIAFACQEVAEVPAEPHDIGLHAILTENGYRRFAM